MHQTLANFHKQDLSDDPLILPVKWFCLPVKWLWDHRKTAVEITSVQRHEKKIGFQKGDWWLHQQDENKEASEISESVWASVWERERPDQWKEGEARKEMRAGWGCSRTGNTSSSNLRREEGRQTGCRARELFLGQQLQQSSTSDSSDHFTLP